MLYLGWICFDMCIYMFYYFSIYLAKDMIAKKKWKFKYESVLVILKVFFFICMMLCDCVCIIDYFCECMCQWDCMLNALCVSVCGCLSVCVYRQLRDRRMLLQITHIPLRTRRALVLFTLYSNYSAILVLNGTSLICLLALSWHDGVRMCVHVYCID